MVGQRIFGLVLGYEDLNDHDELRKDPTFGVLAGKLHPVLRSDCEALAGKSTLNRLEHTPRRHACEVSQDRCEGSRVDELLVELFLEAHDRAPREIVLDLDNTDIPLHGGQEGRFFHGYYDEFCYLPLYVFCGRHLLLARQRRAPAAAGSGSAIADNSEEAAMPFDAAPAGRPPLPDNAAGQSAFVLDMVEFYFRGGQRGLPVQLKDDLTTDFVEQALRRDRHISPDLRRSAGAGNRCRHWPHWPPDSPSLGIT